MDSYVRHGGAASASLLSNPSGEGPVIVTEIHVWQGFRGRGWASDLLKEITASADREGVVLMLSVDPGPFGLDAQQLVDWYSRHGFQQVEAEGKIEPDVMARLPQPSV